MPVGKPALSYSGPVPLYLQIADFVAAEIDGGRLASGERFPSERDLGELWGVAYLTVRRAMRELRARGLVVATQGRGTYVV